jgi:hypothetical protein
MKTTQERLTSAWKKAESYKVTANLARSETEDKSIEECVAATVTHMTEGKPLVSMQVNSRGIYYLFNFIDTYNQYVVIETASWLSEEISNAEVSG